MSQSTTAVTDAGKSRAWTAQRIAFIGVSAALSFIAYEFFRIPNVFGTGSSFHLGNTFTALTAMLLDGVSGGLAGAIGLSMADICGRSERSRRRGKST